MEFFQIDMQYFCCFWSYRNKILETKIPETKIPIKYPTLKRFVSQMQPQKGFWFGPIVCTILFGLQFKLNILYF